MTLVRSGIRVAAVVLLTAALSWLGLYSGRGAGRVPAVWWANAALVSVMLLQAARETGETAAHSEGSGALTRVSRWGEPRRNWPLLLAAGYIGNVIAHLALGDPASQALVLSACDIAEVAMAAYGVGFVLGGGVDLTEQRQLVQFVGCAVLLAPAVASMAAATALWLLTGSSIVESGLRWFPPSALGMSIIPPLVLGLARRDTWALFQSQRLLKTLLYLLTIGAATTAIFCRSDFALLFLVIPPLLFLVLRLALSGGALGCCVVAVVGTAFTVEGHGGFLMRFGPALEQRILMLQMFLATAVLSVSVVGVVLADLKRAGREVRESELRYRSLAASMEMLATLDPLTLVANRRRFDETLQVEWQRGIRRQSPLSLVLVDVDFFKSYNDYFGHLAGDECLKRMAETMSGLARRPADLVARFGGEEFGMVLPETDAEGALLMARNLCQRIESLRFLHPASPVGQVTVSGGCATIVPTPGEAPLALLSAADSALYEAKRKGRNRVEVFEFETPSPAQA